MESSSMSHVTVCKAAYSHVARDKSGSYILTVVRDDEAPMYLIIWDENISVFRSEKVRPIFKIPPPPNFVHSPS